MKVSASRLKVFLAITGAIKGTSRLKLYNEISSESLKFRRWFRKLCTFYDININSLPSYLFDLIPKSSHMYNTPSLEDVATLYSRTGIFKYLFFLSTISKWNKLDLKIRQSKTLLNLRNCFSNLNHHKFNHNFQDFLNPLCLCSLEVESVSHSFLHCHYYANICSTLLNELQSIDINLLNQVVLLYGSTKFHTNQNSRLLISSIDYVIKSERLSGSFL